MKIRRYIDYNRGKSPIVLSCPHGGYKKPHKIPDKLKGDKLPDDNTLFIAKNIINRLNKNGTMPYHIISKILRGKIDFNRPPLSAAAYNKNSIEAQKIHECYQNILALYTKDCLDKFQKCLVIDLHGFTKPTDDYPDIIMGNIFGNSLQVRTNSVNRNDQGYWIFSELTSQLSHRFTIDDGLGLDNYNVAYSGGYILYHYFQKEKN